MTSIIKVDTVQNTPGTNIINKCSVTTTIGAGAGETVAVCAATVNLGRCGGTVNLTAGATQSGFGRTGTVDWQTGSIKTSAFTAANGEGYFINTTSGGVTMNLPAGTAADIVSCVDYTNTAATNNITISANGSEKIQGSTVDHLIETNGGSATLVYVDGTEGWKLVSSGTSADLPIPVTFTAATVSGSCNTLSTCGDYKIAKFKNPGTFCVTSAGNSPVNPAGGPATVDYMVVGGGGAGGGDFYSTPGRGAGGGGAGGYRESESGDTGCWSSSPLSTPTGITVTAQAYPIAVGGGGAGAYGTQPSPNSGIPGVASSFDTISSAGGGRGASHWTGQEHGDDGGSGGGAPNDNNNYGDGNTPPVSPPQGNRGGGGSIPWNDCNSGGGGGGALAVGGTASTGTAGAGGAGTTTNIDTASTAYAGGGGGGGGASTGGGSGGTGGGGSRPSGAGTAFTGGGGASNSSPGAGPTGAGGSGIVVLRYKFQ